ncbi:autotransporter domain-containing protein [Campylobacter concisus]|uniref:autotransporter domain-containing protein n=1 Tax=Campylobacter concisus TaxID=199 RepID=UPI0018832AAC|nr:autotransporter domain-containing protein [Campylobacter concisus]MBE9863131.1 autotransporter domain-containing protein [Campylobacter concisus]
MTQVKILQGIPGLKDWDGAATNADPEKAKTFKKISEAVAAIKDELDKIKPASGSLEIKAADDTSKLTIDSTGAVKVNIDGNGGKQEATGDVTLDFANPAANAADIAKIFSDKNANVWNEFVKAFADEHAKLVKERDEKLADDIKTTLDPAIQTAAVALATAETTAPTYEGTVKNYDALNDALKNDVAAKEKAKAEKEKELATAVKALQTGADKDKVALKGTDATSIAKQADAVTTAKNELTTAAAGSDDDAKKDALKKAIAAGVPVENAGKKLSAADVDKLSTTDLGTVATASVTKAGDAETAMATVKTDATAVKAQDTIIETSTKAIADQKAKVKEISNTRAKAIATSENLDKGESDVLTALSDIFDSNARVESIIADESADDVAEGVSELHSTLDTATKSLNKGNFTDIVIFNTNLATNTRLAKLSNPYNGNLALAYAVKNMAGEKFADNGSDALSSVVKEYTNRYNYDNNLWGNVFGGKAKVKDAANTDVYGFTLGYDKAFDNTIVGGFFTLAKAQSDGNNVKNDANNYSFGVYTRSYFGQNELDSKFAYGFAKNTLKTKSSLIGDNEGKYDSKYFDIALDYGYVFDIGNAKFVKPIFGLEYTNLKNDSFTAGGPVELNFAKTSVKTLNAKLGAEFRAYTEKGDYFYVTPGIERELSKSADDSVLNFAGSRNVTFDADKKKYTYATLKTGAEFKITNSLSTNINFGVKARSKNQFYNGTLGLSYKF